MTFNLEYLETIIKARTMTQCLLVDLPKSRHRMWPRLILRAIADHKYGAYFTFRMYQRSVWLELKLRQNPSIFGFVRKVRLFFRHQISNLWFRIMAVIFLGRVSPFAEIDPGTNITFDNMRICAGSRLHPGVFLSGNLALISNEGLAPTIREGAKLLTGCVIVGGVTVGANAWVSAQSVVIADVPELTTVLGNPAKVVFRRSAPETEDRPESGVI